MRVRSTYPISAQQILRGVQYFVDDPNDPHECPLVTLTAYTVGQMPGERLPWKMMRGEA